MKPFHETLAPLLEGWAVTKVEAGTGREGDPALVTCMKDGVTRSFEIWGGIYGPAVNKVTESRVGAPQAYRNVQDMLDAIIEHVNEVTKDDPDGEGEVPAVIIHVDDPMNRQLGFKCVRTGREWWVNLVVLKGSPYMQRFTTVAAREELARCLSQGVLSSS